MHRYAFFFPAAGLAALSFAAVAKADPRAPASAVAPDEATSPATSVSALVVTANRGPIELDKVGQSITVLSAAAIVRDQETSLGDILAREPGVSLSRNGGPGQTTSLFLRGADSDQTLVLIDGVKVNDPSSPGTGYDFANLLAGDTARVEVLRGPQSTLYGSAAIGGVVNVLTQEATSLPEGEARLEGGSFGTSYVSAGVGGKTGNVDWHVAGYADASKGIPCFDRQLGGRRPCAYHDDGLTARLRVDLTPDLQLDQRAYYTWARTDFDGYDTPTFSFGDDGEYGHAIQWIEYTGVNLSLFDGRLKNRLAFQYADTDHNDQDPGQPASLGVSTTTTFIGAGRVATLEYEGTFEITPDWRAVFGAQNERSTYVSFSPAFQAAPDRAKTTLASGYAQITGDVLRNLTITFGGRYDDQTGVGGHFDGQASAAWRLNDGNTILRASFGQGFKAPSLYQLYSEYGNRALRPESADGWDAGIEQKFAHGRVDLQATYFGRISRELIDFVSCYGVTTGACATNTSGGYYDNVARARAEGVELSARWTPIDQLDLTANYTLDDVEDRSPGAQTHGLQLARRPRDQVNAAIGYVWPVKLRTDVALRWVGASFDDAAHTLPLKSYTLVDLRASYPIGNHLEVYGRIENLTNQHYETTFQYGTPGRAAYGGVRVSF